MASKVWLSLCLVLFAFSFKDLLERQYQLDFKIVEKSNEHSDKENDTNFLVCVSFDQIKQFDSLNERPEAVPVNRFLNYSIRSIEHRLNVDGLFSLNESYIFNDHVCFLAAKNDLEGVNLQRSFDRFLETYEQVSIFIYSKGKQTHFYERAYQKDDNHSSVYLKAFKQKVFNKNHLLNADCSNKENQIKYNRFKCLHECQRRFKIKTDFYDSDDTQLFDLNQIVKGGNASVSSEENFDLYWSKYYCLRNCPQTDCFWEVIVVVKIDSDYYYSFLQNEGKEKVDLRTEVYSVYYPNDGYYLQLFGLLTLFCGTSILRLLPALLSLAVSKCRKHHLRYYRLLRVFWVVYPKIKFTLTFFSFLFVLNLSLIMVDEFKLNSRYPNMTRTLNYTSEPFSVVVCFPVECFAHGKTGEKKSSSYLEEHDLQWIEDHTINLSTTEISKMQLFSAKKLVKTSFAISPDVLFKNSTFEKDACLSRCFRIEIEVQDSHLMPLFYLRIEFKTAKNELFLIEKNRNFTSGLVDFRGLFYPFKMTKKYSKKSKKSRCRDYSKEHGCDSRRSCYDRCLNRKFIENYGSLPLHSIFSKNNLPPFISSGKDVYFSETVDRAIEECCSDLFNQTDCYDVIFDESYELVHSKRENFTLIRLTYLNIVKTELEYEPTKTLLDLISLASIFFSLNVTDSLTTGFFVLSKIFRIKWHRAYNAVIMLLSLAGFLVHVVLVFQSKIRGDLSESGYFEMPPRYSLPSPIFCFPFPRTIDENHRVTGEYLNDLSSNLTFKDVFSKIVYYNGSYETVLNISQLEFTKGSNFYRNWDLKLTHFYFTGLKCFKVRLRFYYWLDKLISALDKNVLKIHLKRSLKESDLFFFHQQQDSNEIGSGSWYSIGKSHETPDSHFSYNIEFELFSITRVDNFELFKDPRSLFSKQIKVNDPTEMGQQFKEDCSRTTDNLLLDSDFGLEMDNELSQQFFRQIKSASDQTRFKSQNFEKDVANVFNHIFHSSDSPDFSFSFSLLTKRIEITNSENFSILLFSVLNMLSLWLNICILEVDVYINQVLCQFLQLHRLLIWLRRQFKRKIEESEINV